MAGRIGEVMVASGVLTAEQVDHALRAQVVWGGRFGTNLIELGLIDLDALSAGLGLRHGLPVAFARHFDKGDAELQKLLPGKLAERWGCVPLLRLPSDQVAIACMDPLEPTALIEVADALSVTPDKLVISVAAELRVRYHLERAYGIKREARFLRSKGKNVAPFPQIEIKIGPDAELEVDFDSFTPIETPIELPQDLAAFTTPTVRAPAAPDIPMPVVDTPTSRIAIDELAALIETAAEATPVTPPSDDAPSGRDRRTYVRTLTSDPDPEPATEPPPAATSPATGTLGRIAIRRVAVTGSPVAVEGAKVTASLTDALRAIKRGVNRDKVADLVVAALERHVPACHAAFLFVVRGDAAISWRTFSRVENDFPELAVPLDQPGLVPLVVQKVETTVGVAGDLSAVDTKLLAVLGKADGELVVAPIAIAGSVLCLLVAALEPAVSPADLDAIAGAAGAAFTRLIRDASR